MNLKRLQVAESYMSKQDGRMMTDLKVRAVDVAEVMKMVYDTKDLDQGGWNPELKRRVKDLTGNTRIDAKEAAMITWAKNALDEFFGS